jgi:hypothetical protein
MTVIDTICRVTTPMYVHNNKTYIECELNQKVYEMVNRSHDDTAYKLRARNIQNPLIGNILKIKVPSRNGQISCAMTGDKSLRAIQTGEFIDITMSFCGAWNYRDFCGWAWKLNRVCLSTIDYL